MGELNLQSGERYLAKAKAQLAKGFPQTAGDFYLTNYRLVLEPDQFASLGFGKRWEVSLSRIKKIEKLDRFEGGTYIGKAGKKLVVHLDDSSIHTFSFYLGSDIDIFIDVLKNNSTKQVE